MDSDRPPLLDLIRQRNARESQSTTRLWLQSPGQSVEAAKAASGAIRPTPVAKGMSGGKITAIVAAVGLAGAGLYALSRSQESGSWVQRVDAKRAQSRQDGLTLNTTR